MSSADTGGAESTSTGGSDSGTGGDPGPVGTPCSNEIGFRTDRSGTFQVVRADVSTTDLVEVTSGGGVGSFAWAPDGSRVVFEKAGPVFTELHVADIASGEESLLVGMDRDVRDPEWAPSGYAIVFHTADGSGAELWWAHENDGTTSVLAQYPGASSLDVAWSPDADAVAVAVEGEGVPGLWRVSVPSGDSELLDDSLSEYANPAWSPLGDEIAFAGNDELLFRAHVIGTDGSDLRAVTQGFAIQVGWSPEADRLVYRGSEGASDFRLFTVDLAAGIESLLVPDLSCAEPRWCGEPDLILTYCSGVDGGDDDIYLVDPDGTAEAFAAAPARDEFPRWRPAPL